MNIYVASSTTTEVKIGSGNNFLRLSGHRNVQEEHQKGVPPGSTREQGPPGSVTRESRQGAREKQKVKEGRRKKSARSTEFLNQGDQTDQPCSTVTGEVVSHTRKSGANSMPALDLMPSGVRCAPWGVWLQGPESPCGTSAQRCSLQGMAIRARRGRVRVIWKLKLISNTRTSGASVAI